MTLQTTDRSRIQRQYSSSANKKLRMKNRKSVKDLQLEKVAMDLSTAAFGDRSPSGRHNSVTSLSLAGDYRRYNNNLRRQNSNTLDMASPERCADNNRKYKSESNETSPDTKLSILQKSKSLEQPDCTFGQFEATSTWTPGSYRRRVSVFQKVPTPAEDVSPVKKAQSTSNQKSLGSKMVKIAEPIHEDEDESSDQYSAAVLSESYVSERFSDTTGEPSSAENSASNCSPVFSPLPSTKENEIINTSPKESSVNENADDAKVEEFLRNVKAEDLDVNGKIKEKGFFKNRHSYPLHVAVKENRLDMVNLLIAKGANVASRNSSGKTPEEVAKRVHKKDPSLLVNALGRKAELPKA